MAVELDERMEKLVDLYSQYPVEQIRSDDSVLKGAFNKSIEDLCNEWGFSEAQAFVEELKELIEENETDLKVPDKKQQVAESLGLINNLILFDESEKSVLNLKIAVLRALFLKAVAEPARWSTDQKAHFDYVIHLLADCQSCFISYTNEGAKGINKKFAKVIDWYVDRDILDERDHDRHNLLADAVFNRLKGHNLIPSFFDKANIKPNDNIMDKVRPACENTFAFIQLVQRETFMAIARRNWCFEEYQMFTGAVHNRLEGHMEYEKILELGFSPVHTDEDKKHLMAARQPFVYEPWIKRIFQDQHFTTLPVDPEKFDDAMSELSDAIANLEHQIICNVPN